MAVGQGARGLRQHDEVRRAATAADGAAAAVEEGDVHLVPLAHLQELLHGTVQLPSGGEPRVRVRSYSKCEVGVRSERIESELDRNPMPEALLELMFKVFRDRRKRFCYPGRARNVETAGLELADTKSRALAGILHGIRVSEHHLLPLQPHVVLKLAISRGILKVHGRCQMTFR